MKTWLLLITFLASFCAYGAGLTVSSTNGKAINLTATGGFTATSLTNGIGQKKMNSNGDWLNSSGEQSIANSGSIFWPNSSETQFIGTGGNITDKSGITIYDNSTKSFYGNFFVNSRTSIITSGILKGMPFNQGTEVILWYGDSKGASLGNPFMQGASASLGWLAYGDVTNSSLASTVTNQPDGSVWYNTGAYTTNNLSLGVIFTNQMAIQTGYTPLLRNVNSVPAQTSVNIGFGVTSDFVTSDLTGQNGNFTYNGSGQSSMALYGYGGNAAVTWYPSSTNDHHITVNSISYTNGYYTGVGSTNVTFTPSWPAGTTMTLTFFGTATSNSTTRVFGPSIAGSQYKYTSPHLWGSIIYGTTNISPATDIVSNSPAVTGKRTMLVVGPIGGNDFLNGNSGQFNVGYTPWSDTVGWSNRVDLEISNILYVCRMGRTNNLFPIVVTTYPWAYNLFNSQGGGAVGKLSTNLMEYLNFRLRNLSPNDVDFIVPLDTICNPANAASSGAFSIGDNIHPSAATSTNWSTFTMTNAGFSSVLNPFQKTYLTPYAAITTGAKWTNTLGFRASLELVTVANNAIGGLVNVNFKRGTVSGTTNDSWTVNYFAGITAAAFSMTNQPWVIPDMGTNEWILFTDTSSGGGSFVIQTNRIHQK